MPLPSLQLVQPQQYQSQKHNLLHWTFYSCSFKDKEVQRDAKMVSYDVVDKKGKPYVQVEVSGEKKSFSPEEISAMILGKMKETAGTLIHFRQVVTVGSFCAGP